MQWKLKAGRSKDAPSSGKLPPLNKGLLNVGSLTGSAPDVRLVIEAEREENLKKIEDTHTVSQEEKEIQEELAKQQKELDRLKKDLDAKSDGAEKGQELAQGLSETIEQAAPLSMEKSGEQMEAEQNLINMLVSQVMSSARERGINIPKWQAEAVKFQVERAMANSRQNTRSAGSALPRPLTGTRPRTGNRPLTGTGRVGTPLSRLSTPMVGGVEVHFPGAMDNAIGFQSVMQMEKDGQGFYRMQIPEGAGVWKVTSNRELIVHSVSDGFDGV